jgi:Eukaryotic aspartyl protease
MVTDKLISSNAYSLWLNDLDANTGSILFGGVDTDQFEGTLATLPIQQEGGEYAEFLIALTAVSIAGTSIVTNQNIAVLLDSGTSLTYLPNAITQSIYDSVGAQYDNQAGTAYVPCSLAQNTSTIDYTFTSPTIKITMAELVLDLTDANGQPVTFSNGQQACIFGIAPAGSSTSILGDTFLRSAYVVYDLSNNQISLAQTKFNVTTSNVLEIGTGSSAVPSATAVQGAASATSASGGGSLAGNPAAAASSAAAAASMKTAAPLGAVVAVGAAMLFAAM